MNNNSRIDAPVNKLKHKCTLVFTVLYSLVALIHETMRHCSVIIMLPYSTSGSRSKLYVPEAGRYNVVPVASLKETRTFGLHVFSWVKG